MLVVFDVDGTLTRTEAADTLAYASAFRHVFGVELPTKDWAAYRHATDRGIAHEAVERARLDPGRIPLLAEKHVEMLRAALAHDAAAQVPGAARLLARLEADRHAVAFATGAWEGSACAKLSSAGIGVGTRVLVGSDHHADRVEIIREVLRRSPRESRTVYVGDGTWDVKAARELRLPFVGIGSHATGTLWSAGARVILADFADMEAALAALVRAPCPVG